jgi:hypothetical protein
MTVLIDFRALNLNPLEFFEKIIDGRDISVSCGNWFFSQNLKKKKTKNKKQKQKFLLRFLAFKYKQIMEECF